LLPDTNAHYYLEQRHALRKWNSCMLELDGTIWLRSGLQHWGGAQRVELLSRIGQTGSITAAAKAVGISYKTAWDAVDTMNNLAGEPLVLRAAGGKGGGGTRLTARALRLIEMFRALDMEHQRFIQQLGTLGEASIDDIELMRRFMIRTSARNQLLGTVVEVQGGSVNDVIELEVQGGQRIVATVTHDSTENLGLKPGRQATALIKASSVLIGLADPAMRLSARNQLAGSVSALSVGAVNTEVAVALDKGGVIVAIVTNTSAQSLELAEGSKVLAVFKASSVILGTND
jgi:molybdate transport system regulatory protein